MANQNRRTQTQLTAPGATADLALQIAPAERFYSVTVAAINTNVVLRVENTDGTSVTSQGPDYTFTANGTYVLPVYPNDSHVQLNFVSEAGGTDATVDAVLVESAS